MICPKCGASVGDNLVMCIRCGAKLKENPVSTISNTAVNSSKKKKSPLPKLFLFLSVLFIALGGIFLYRESDYAKIMKKYGENPILMENGKKFGYINSKGKVLLEAKYDYAIPFAGNYAEVAIEKDDIVEYQVINKQGKVKMSSTENDGIFYNRVYDYWVINHQLYNQSLKKISPDNIQITSKNTSYRDYLSWKSSDEKSAGIIASNGKITYTYHFAEGEKELKVVVSIDENEVKDKYCTIIIDDQKYGIVNCDTGKVIYDFSDNIIFPIGDNSFHVYTPSDDFVNSFYLQDDKIFYENSNQNIILRPHYYSGYITLENYQINNHEEGKYTYYHLDTGEITSEMPHHFTEWERYTGIQKFSCEAGYGLKKGEKVKVPCEWEDIQFLDVSLYQYLKYQKKEYALAIKEEKTYLIDVNNGKVIQDFNDDSVYSDDSPFLIISDIDSTPPQKLVYYIPSGKMKAFDYFGSLVGTYSNYFVLMNQGGIHYYNTKMESIYSGS